MSEPGIEEGVKARVLAKGAAKAKWGDPLARIDAAWTRLEARLAAFVLITEIIALCAWISLKGLSAEYQPGAGDSNVSGLVFRGLVAAIVLGVLALRFVRPKVKPDDPAYPKELLRQNIVVTVTVVVGLASGRLWANGGVEYFSNFLNWMQSASLLMLIGGLRGVATRLTLWLALLGGSLATGNGKHINIDVVMRFLTPRMRVPVAILGWVSAAVMCIAGAWGFLDHIAIALFHVKPMTACADDATKMCPTPPGEKLAEVAHDMGTDLFIIGRQLSLDVQSFPRVIIGRQYNGYLTGSDWNTWVNDADWASHFPGQPIQGLLVTPERLDATHIPAVSIPGGQEVRGLLIKDADLVFPFGLLMIALRFLLRAVLAISGHVQVDPDMAHGEDSEVDHEGEKDAEPEQGMGAT
jgi:TRAP-type C4-dicarboxylate transport system permease small subunit